ncbi:MAG: Ig-like domain-containing protein [Chitinophagales bacterium]
MYKFYFFLFLFFLFSCANEVAPTGGEKDVTPPELKQAKPKNKSVNFNSNFIEFKFNEFIKLKSSSNYVFISPPLKNKPKYILNGKKVRIEFKEELLKNTTYSINFNEAIEDYNEANKLSNLNYVFSTGNYIDSLSISGSVLNAFDNKVVEDILVLLYPEAEDSVLYKRPQYFTKTDKEGNFILNNLKEGKYKIACLEDKNLNYIFDQDNERIAFQEEIINLTEDIISMPFYIFENTKENSLLENTLENNNHLLLNFKKAFSTLNLDISDYNNDDIVYYSKNKKVLHYWFQDKDTLTTLKLKLDNTLDTLKLDLRNKEEKNTFNVNTKSYLLGENKAIEISSSLPLKSFKENSLFLISNKTDTIPFTFNFTNNNLNLIIEFKFEADSINLTSLEETFTSFNNKQSTAINEVFTDFKPSKSTLILSIPNKEYNYTIQLYNKELELIEEKIVSRETSIEFKNVIAGKYIIRIYEDFNNNGIWDSGLFHVKQLPEKTLFYSTEIELKPNWDKELEINF